jgi:hypothetical protein
MATMLQRGGNIPKAARYAEMALETALNRKLDEELSQRAGNLVIELCRSMGPSFGNIKAIIRARKKIGTNKTEIRKLERLLRDSQAFIKLPEGLLADLKFAAMSED